MRADMWRLVVAAAGIAGAILAGGCGGNQGRAAGDVAGLSSGAQPTPGTTAHVAYGTSTSPHCVDDNGTEGWMAPDREVLDAFLSLRGPLGGRPLFVPSEVPDCTVVASDGRGADWVAAPAFGEVRVVLEGASLQFLEAVEGDIGDVPHREVGRVQGETAAVYAVLGGVLVQWRCEGAWYAVFGRGLTEAGVVRIALGLTSI